MNTPPFVLYSTSINFSFIRRVSITAFFLGTIFPMRVLSFSRNLALVFLSLVLVLILSLRLELGLGLSVGLDLGLRLGYF